MSFKLLQLNIFQGKFLDRIAKFVKSNNTDFLHFQEVTGGSLSRGGKYDFPNNSTLANIISIRKSSRGIDCLKILVEKLGYKAAFVKTMKHKNEPNSYYGNAILMKTNFDIVSEEKIFLKEYAEIKKSFKDHGTAPRAAIAVETRINNRKLSLINTHLAWGPTSDDAPYKIGQAKTLLNFLKKLQGPIILSGDFNVTPDTKTAQTFNSIGLNLVKHYGVINTLNPTVHPVKYLFPPGIAVDYIFVSQEIKVKSFRVVDEIDLSDHFGLLLEFDL